MGEFDAIVVLGGGVRDGGVLPPWSEARFDLALERDCGTPFVALSQAMVHRSSRRGFWWRLPLDTIGNAYFTKILHVDPEA